MATGTVVYLVVGVVVVFGMLLWTRPVYALSRPKQWMAFLLVGMFVAMVWPVVVVGLLTEGNDEEGY